MAVCHPRGPRSELLVEYLNCGGVLLRGHRAVVTFAYAAGGDFGRERVETLWQYACEEPEARRPTLFPFEKNFFLARQDSRD